MIEKSFQSVVKATTTGAEHRTQRYKEGHR